MKIRALTLGVDYSNEHTNLPELKKKILICNNLKRKFEENGIDVQFIRLASPAITPDNIITSKVANNPEKYISTLEDFTNEEILGIYSFIPILADQKLNDKNHKEKIYNLLDKLPSILKDYPNSFSSLQVSNIKSGFNFESLKKGIDIIKELAHPDPFANLKFAITFNVKPNTPFFPSAFHIGNHPKLSIALEAADIIVNLQKEIGKDPKHQNPDFKQIQLSIKETFTKIYDKIAAIAEPFCLENGWEFVGIDLSPAPYPTEEKSIGTAIEQLSIGKFGDFGTVFGVGLLTQALQSIDRKYIGFSGFMQPLLEDEIIGRRNTEGFVSIEKLTLYSTMCGLGLDCIPLAGDISKETLFTMLLDLGMISLRLNKPLTARLMPIPGKKGGDLTTFNFEYFTNSKICSPKKNSTIDLNNFKRYFELI